MGASRMPLNASAPIVPVPGDSIEIGVCGAHMTGLPLNGELKALGGTYARTVKTAGDYRLYALAGPKPDRPGLVRSPGKGAPIEIEVWRLPVAAVGSLLTAIPAPLGLGTIALADGTSVKGFICEASAVADARDITHHGGWRSYLAEAGDGGETELAAIAD
ncbi:MAG: hypothetical protein ACMVY4_12965 [Minwuia sp.]|uniref:allophanate hydrolase-related protein n=1 Tax=Minwuia sp. TaxID=2493630 RepID=UPI003A836417